MGHALSTTDKGCLLKEHPRLRMWVSPSIGLWPWGVISCDRCFGGNSHVLGGMLKIKDMHSIRAKGRRGLGIHPCVQICRPLVWGQTDLCDCRWRILDRKMHEAAFFRFLRPLFFHDSSCLWNLSYDSSSAKNSARSASLSPHSPAWRCDRVTVAGSEK